MDHCSLKAPFISCKFESIVHVFLNFITFDYLLDMFTLDFISPGSVILDLEEEVLPDIVTRIVEELITDCQIEEDHKAVFKWMFELRHRSV